MIDLTLNKDSVKRNSLIISFVLFSLFAFENLFACCYWNKDLIHVSRDSKNDYIKIKTEVYNYKIGSNIPFKFAYPISCKFEASADGKNYYKLMELYSKRQNYGYVTLVNLKNKLMGAKIELLGDAAGTRTGKMWTDELSSNVDVQIDNHGRECHLEVGWYAEQPVRFIRVSGKWYINDLVVDDEFKKVVYEIKSSNHLKLNTPDIITNVSSKNTVRVFKESKAIVIKGAKPGANIKVYTSAGVEIRSLISNNDNFKINLPSNQSYFIIIGKSRYKVAL